MIRLVGWPKHGNLALSHLAAMIRAFVVSTPTEIERERRFYKFIPAKIGRPLVPGSKPWRTKSNSKQFQAVQDRNKKPTRVPLPKKQAHCTSVRREQVHILQSKWLQVWAFIHHMQLIPAQCGQTLSALSMPQRLLTTLGHACWCIDLAMTRHRP